jgi:hypothetical protein
MKKGMRKRERERGGVDGGVCVVVLLVNHLDNNIPFRPFCVQTRVYALRVFVLSFVSNIACILGFSNFDFLF